MALTRQRGVSASAGLPVILIGRPDDPHEGGVPMAIDPEKFAQALSNLTNSLQTALLLAAHRATAAREATAETDAVYRAIGRAVEAARELRAAGEKGEA